MRIITGGMRVTPINALLPGNFSNKDKLSNFYIYHQMSSNLIKQLKKIENTVTNRNKYWGNIRTTSSQKIQPFIKNLEKKDISSWYETRNRKTCKVNKNTDITST